MTIATDYRSQGVWYATEVPKKNETVEGTAAYGTASGTTSDTVFAYELFHSAFVTVIRECSEITAERFLLFTAMLTSFGLPSARSVVV